MAFYKNKASQKIPVYAHDKVANAPKTGDAANITASLSKDGGAPAATNDVNPTELSATNAPGVYVFDITQAESNADLLVLAAKSTTANVEIRPLLEWSEPEDRRADVIKLNGDATAAANLAAAAKAEITGAAVAGTLSTTQMTTNLIETRDDQYNGRVVIFTSGALFGLAATISDYDGGTKKLTFGQVSVAPSAGDAFVIV